MVQARPAAGGKPGIAITATVGNSVKMYSIDEVPILPGAGQVHARRYRCERGAHPHAAQGSRALDSETFWQVHRSVIVRVGAIHAVEKGDDGKLQLTVRGRQDVLPVKQHVSTPLQGM